MYYNMKGEFSLENTTTVSARVDAKVLAAARQKLAPQGLTVSGFVRLALIKAARGEVDVLQLQGAPKSADDVSQLTALVDDLIDYQRLVDYRQDPMWANALKSLFLMHICLDCYLDRPNQLAYFAQWQTMEMELLKPDYFDRFYAMFNADFRWLARLNVMPDNQLLLNAVDNYNTFFAISDQQKSLRSFMKELFELLRTKPA